jgi:hypothetical protein
MLRRSIRIALLLPLVITVAHAEALHAQTVGVSAGLAAPLGPLGEHRGVGLRVQGSLYSPERLLRVDVAGTFFPGDGRGGETVDYGSASVGANLTPVLVRVADARIRGLAGLSVHRVHVTGDTNPYGLVPGLQLGAVVDGAWDGRTLFAETGVHVIASDYGVGDFGVASFVPVTIGIRF